MSLSMYERIVTSGLQKVSYSNVYTMLAEIKWHEARGIWTDILTVGGGGILRETARTVRVEHRLMTNEEQVEAIIDGRMCIVEHVWLCEQEERAVKELQRLSVEYVRENPGEVAWEQYTDPS